MVQKNINAKRKDSGFTIVELLVVIVVIAILAAITIVSYTGITAKANTTKAQSNADSVASVANIYAADSTNTGYPADAAALNGYTAGYARIPVGLTVQAGGAAVLPGSNPTTTILYRATTGNLGACIGYWDQVAGAMAYKYVGDGDTASLNIASPTCT